MFRKLLNTFKEKYIDTEEQVRGKSSEEVQATVSKREPGTTSAQPRDSHSAEEPTESDLIDAINDLTDTLGRAPTTTDMKEQGRFKPHQYYNAFGRWADALERAELDVESDLVSNLRRVADNLDEYPTKSVLNEHGRYDANWYDQYFKTWDAARNAADIEPPTEKDLIEEIQRLDREYNRIPSRNFMQAEGRYPQRHIRDQFGSWDEALEAAGIDKRKRLIDELQRINSECEGRPTTTIANEMSVYSATYFANQFGSWTEAIEEAQISVDQGSASRSEMAHEETPDNDDAPPDEETPDNDDAPPDEELIEELQRLYNELDRVPAESAIRDHSVYSPEVYQSQFKDWDDALLTAGITDGVRPTGDSNSAEINSNNIDHPPTDEQLCNEIQRLDNEYERIPLTTRMREEGKYSPQEYYNRFGSWTESLKAAGINKRDRLIQELKWIGDRCDGRLTSTFFNDHSAYNSGYIINTFGSWDEALKAAGIADSGESDWQWGRTNTGASESDDERIQPNELAELYESLRVLSRILNEYVNTTSGISIGNNDPVANWQSVIEDVAIGEGINSDVPCLEELQSDRNPFSMSEYREQYGDGDQVTDYQALNMSDISAEREEQLIQTADSSHHKVQRPTTPRNGKPLPVLISNGSSPDQAIQLLKELLTDILDIDIVEPPTMVNDDSKIASTKSATRTTSGQGNSEADLDPLTLADTETNKTHDRPIVGRLIGSIVSPSGEATSQLHLLDITGEDFWLYIVDYDENQEWKNGNWYFISQFRGPEEEGGGRGVQALRSTPQLLVEDHGSTLPPAVNPDISNSDSITRSDIQTAAEKKDQQKTNSDHTIEKNNNAKTTVQELLKELKRIDRKIDRIPYPSDINERTRFTAHTYHQQFGSWDDALESAGIDKRDRLLTEFRRLEKELEKVPTTMDMNDHGTYSNGIYNRYFGSWTATKKQYREWKKERNKDTISEDASQVKSRNDHKDNLDNKLRGKRLKQRLFSEDS